MSLTKSRTKALALTAVACLAVATLAACADTSTDEPTAGSTTTAGGGESEPAADPADISGDITWWGWTPGSPVNEQYIAAFNEEYPNVKVTWKQTSIDDYNAAMQAALAAGTGIDLYEMSAGSANGGVQVYGGNAIDLTPAVQAALGDNWKDLLSGTGVDALTVDGELKALAAGAVYAGTVWINQDLFDKYGVEAPTDWDSWKSACATFESNGVTCFVQGAAQGAFNMDTFHAIADNVEPGKYIAATRGEIPWTDPSLVKALELWKQLFDEGIMPSDALGVTQYPDANNLFMSQKAAMVMMGTWYSQNLIPDVMKSSMEAAGSTDEPFTMIPIYFPDIAGTGNTGSLFGDVDYGQGVAATSKNIEAATAFAVWLGTSDKGQQAIADSLNLIPALKSVTPNWDNVTLVNNDTQAEPVKKMVQAAAAVADNPRFQTINADMNDAMQAVLAQVADGSSSPADAAASLEASQESVG